MKILIVTQKVDLQDNNLGFFHGWLERLSRGADLAVIANYLGEQRLPDNVQIYSLGKEKRISRLRRWWRYQWLLWRLLPGVEGVFFHMCPEYVLASVAAVKLLRKRSLFWYVHKQVSVRLRLAEKLADKIFSASLDSFRLPSRKLEVIGHGIDLALFQPGTQRKQSELRLLTVGRISPVKDLETLILAARELISKLGNSVNLDIVGAPVLRVDEIYFQRLQEMATAAGLQEQVRFLGGQPYFTLPEIYRSHDIFIHASRTGSVDKAVLEALACGLPVFTSSPAYDNLSMFVTRFAENDYQDLADKIASACTNGKIRVNAEAVKWIAEHHNLDNLVKKIIAYFPNQ